MAVFFSAFSHTFYFVVIVNVFYSHFAKIRSHIMLVIHYKASFTYERLVHFFNFYIYNKIRINRFVQRHKVVTSEACIV